jgi:hypothetical protein
MEIKLVRRQRLRTITAQKHTAQKQKITGQFNVPLVHRSKERSNLAASVGLLTLGEHPAFPTLSHQWHLRNGCPFCRLQRRGPFWNWRLSDKTTSAPDSLLVLPDELGNSTDTKHSGDYNR